MKEKIYTIKNLCNELNQPRQKVRRRIEKLDIKAINDDTRIHENEPLEYDHQAFLKLAKEFDVKINNTECTASVQQRTANEQHRTAEETSKDKLIMVLEKQLEEANKSRANLEKLLDQQQQLTLVSNKKIELLRLELEEKESEKQIDEGINKEEMKKDEKKKWWQFFR
ncbi:DUF536 domain-containing protein [Listeria monocytogenes]|uniref:DUF536 domain-containing protein n=1 Tax=Vagococcus lutrae TaxID=81947 RepID=UPI000EECC3D9|nr:DUF536 domain-containing protein [Vagococcus lutrae]EAC3880319.1 DUF536 domain-containing protein [Listeria monocytogenes]EAC6338610.1 DUF536 domain-containing protein [Listeria monocytogenes]EAD7911103.1 DUF536 domain-containing protein [Listeria monocytogenes]EAD8928252.1 DUF536 domain-containing protein [Listeria monocytogenes]EAE6573175.1 DUF536 domain-containing protein [Listeria monocytogenes]